MGRTAASVTAVVRTVLQESTAIRQAFAVQIVPRGVRRSYWAHSSFG